MNPEPEKATQSYQEEFKNRHERRAQAALDRSKMKKFKKYNSSLKKMFDKIGIDPNQVEQWNEEKVNSFKEEISQLKKTIAPLQDLAVNS